MAAEHAVALQVEQVAQAVGVPVQKLIEMNEPWLQARLIAMMTPRAVISVRDIAARVARVQGLLRRMA